MSCGSRKPFTIPSMPGIQPFPIKGALRRSLNTPLADLRWISAKLLVQPVYVYIVTSVKNCGGFLGQTGTGPNFQSDRITLCTCKHKDRALWPLVGKRGTNSADHWQGMWVAGLCS
jgi:hypothetical protein